MLTILLFSTEIVAPRLGGVASCHAVIYIASVIYNNILFRGGPLDILGGGQKNFPCKNFFFSSKVRPNFFFMVEALQEFFLKGFNRKK